MSGDITGPLLLKRVITPELRKECSLQDGTTQKFHCLTCRTGQLPWDRAQGLNERLWSPAVKALAVGVGARLPYRETAGLLERLLGYALEESSLQELVQEIGATTDASELSSRVHDECIVTTTSCPVAARRLPALSSDRRMTLTP